MSQLVHALCNTSEPREPVPTHVYKQVRLPPVDVKSQHVASHTPRGGEVAMWQHGLEYSRMGYDAKFITAIKLSG
jgi:hypothetical protein